LNRSGILIISDDPEFARSVASNWQNRRHGPEITLATSDVGRPASGAGHGVVIVGPVKGGRLSAILSELELSQSAVTISIVDDEDACALLAHKHPHIVVLPRQRGQSGPDGPSGPRHPNGWMASLLAVSGEAFRHVEAVRRAQRAERLAIENQNYATLGRYMLDVRSSVNNALTSVLGNADLLLLDRAQMVGDSREQVQTIHAMALRLSEVMQRFSSLVSEIRLSEKESQPETKEPGDALITSPGTPARRA
jgi:signal transduction histidine kinase